MKKIKHTALWFYMLGKRLFRKYSFLVILLLIPLLLPLANAAMRSESGVLKIALSYEGKNNPGAETVVEKLRSEKSILLYKEYNTPEEARQAVETGEVDGAWIFTEDFDKAVRAYTERKRSAPLITVLERESTVPLQLAREKLYGAVYPQISRGIYENFVKKSFSEAAAEDMGTYYEMTAHGDNVIRTEKLHESKMASETNYLTAPLRGLLAIMILLCGLATAMYYLEDDEEGRFDWLPQEKRILPAMGTCFAGVLTAAVTVFVSLLCAGIHTSLWRELIAMALYIPAVVGFSLCLAMLVKKAGHLGAIIPCIILGTLALSPIFFQVKAVPMIRALLPVQYYLQAIHNTRFILYMALYDVCIFALIVCFIYGKRSIFKKSL